MSETAPHNQPFDLLDAVNGFLRASRQKASHRGLSIDCEIEPDTPRILIGDPMPLCRTIGILVDTALNHSAACGNISLHICEADLDDEAVLLCVSVTDHGSGLGEELTSVLLGTTRTAATDATGAEELLTARQLIEVMGGEVWVDSVPGHGSISQFTAHYSVHHAPPSASVSASGPLHILLVDDVEINQELARIVMEKEGHRVTVAGNGAEALAYFQEHRFDMIFMDIQMPTMDGFQATAAIREMEQATGGHTPIIAMTAYSSSQDLQDFLNAGMDFCVAKPVKPDVIIAAINRYAAAQQPEAAARALAPAGDSPHDDSLIPVFDRDELLERLGGNIELVPRFTAMFMGGVETGIAAIRKALTTGDFAEVHRQGHTLKGAAANIGACRIREVAAALDEAATSHDISTAPALLAELEQNFDLFKREIERNNG